MTRYDYVITDPDERRTSGIEVGDAHHEVLARIAATAAKAAFYGASDSGSEDPAASAQVEWNEPKTGYGGTFRVTVSAGRD